MRARIGWLLLAFVTACATGVPDDGPPPSADAGSDATPPPADSGPADAGPGDTGPMPLDTGVPVDTGAADAGPTDAGPRDTGPADTGPADTGPADTGPADTGPTPVDMDGDGHFSVATGGDDCNDGRADVKPGAAEHCDGVDEDCDGRTDEMPVDPDTFYEDRDGDGYGGEGFTAMACARPIGFSANADDCDDGNGAIRPGGAETCDSVDQDCDGAVDEGVGSTWYRDADGDGHGTAGETTRACSMPVGYASDTTDCNDGAAGIYPGALELCNGEDDNCNGTVDDGAGCPVGCTGGFYGGHSYLFCSFLRPYATARQLCRTATYELAQIDDQLENDYIRAQLNARSIGAVWIGATDQYTEDVWVWDTGTRPVFYRGNATDGGAAEGGAYNRWASSQPVKDASSTNQFDCARQLTTSLWSVTVCDDAATYSGYVCEN